MNRVKNIKDLVLDISSLEVENRLVLIGVEGFSGSGKSTVAASLAAELEDAYLIHIDDFLIKEKMGTPNSDKEAFDRERLRIQVLLPLSQGKASEYQKLIWDKNVLSEPIPIPIVKYVIVEGISSCHPDIASLYDYTIWVEVPLEEAKRRGVNRDQSVGYDSEERWEQWAKNDLAYQQKYRPDERVSAIFENT